MKTRSHLRTVIFSDVARRPMRTFGLAAITAIFAFTAFCGNMLTQSIKTGIQSASARLGADMMLIPSGSDAQIGSTLLRSEPTTFYLPDNITQDVRAADGVAAASEQLYIASLDAACCTVPVQLIGFDPNTDITISPWLNDAYSAELSDDEAVVGSLILAEPGDTIYFYGKPFKVAAVLDETGMGFDSSVFMTLDAARELITEPSYSAAHPALEMPNAVSAVFIDLDDGASADEVRLNLSGLFSGAEVLAADDLTRSISSQLENISGIFTIVTPVLFIVCVLILLFIFSLIFHERQREFALLSAMGATSFDIAGIAVLESLLVSAIGTACGLLLGSLVIFPFSTLIAESLDTPYLMPNPLYTTGLLIVSGLISCASGPLACIYPAVKLSKADAYSVITGNDR